MSAALSMTEVDLVRSGKNLLEHVSPMTEQLALIALARTPHPETVGQIMETIEEAGGDIESHGRVRLPASMTDAARALARARGIEWPS
jgi:hypothetical protein